MRLPIIVAFSACCLAVPCGARAQQGASCHPHTGELDNLLVYARRLISDPAYEGKRTRYSLEPGPQTDVQWVQDENICSEAARAFMRDVGLSTQPQVFVIRVGTRYIVLNPATKAGEFTIHIVFDNRWRRLAGFAG